ncbi:MAG: 16S rRNA (cytidine(1402)-2'-O)-methyltransferase [Dehalococcoidales bacterium]|nr:16S rRNA (cytidine(1402)-2'-O)-methyltransferase [Dehalococcoidales bacterium]
MSTLYIVATPIGNLEDISFRAIRTLREVTLIAAEDTRKTKRLLAHYDIKTPLTSYHEHNKLVKLDYILNRTENEDTALVSNAGMPGISDPGYELIIAATQRNITVVPIPGPSAVTTALVISGLPTDKFIYIGFFPHKSSGRQHILESISNEQNTIVALESPHRLPAALNDMLLILGDRRLTICRELTKIHEEVFRGTISLAIKHFKEPRGEFTLVIEGKKQNKPKLTEEIEERLRNMRISGATAKETIAKIAEETSLPKKEIYQAWLKQ